MQKATARPVTILSILARNRQLMKKTIILLTLLTLVGCAKKHPYKKKPLGNGGSDNDSPIIVSDSSTGFLKTGDKMAAITVGRENVNTWSDPFDDDGAGGYKIHGTTAPIFGSHYQGTCVQGLDDKGNDVRVPLTKNKPWTVDFQNGSVSVFTVHDDKGDDNEALDPKGATLDYSDADDTGNTLITGSIPKAFTKAVVTSQSTTTTIYPLGNTYITIHYCPKGKCSDATKCP
jgi:hypothetical protein